MSESDATVTSDERELFDKLLEEIIAELPEEFRAFLEQVPVMVDDEPPEDIEKEMGFYEEDEPSGLFGLHSGPTASSARLNETISSAPLIQIFRGPILREVGNERKPLRKEIRITLIHELGHHFDFSEKDLEDRGFG